MTQEETKSSSVLKKIWDFYRIAPVGETQTILAVLCFINIVAEEGIVFALPSILLISSSLIITYRQFILKRKLNKILSKGRYKDIIFEPALHFWCDRQTALVVAQAAGVEKEYLKLCKNNRDRMEFPFIPNF